MTKLESDETDETSAKGTLLYAKHTLNPSKVNNLSFSNGETLYSKGREVASWIFGGCITREDKSYISLNSVMKIQYLGYKKYVFCEKCLSHNNWIFPDLFIQFLLSF
ncbi:uncharacterized protein LOC144743304 [Ciona intestinalis]